MMRIKRVSESPSAVDERRVLVDRLWPVIRLHRFLSLGYYLGFEMATRRFSGAGVIAAWRRLFAPSPPSPEMERFIGWLADTPYPWYVASNGKIRAREGDAELCAVTAVARHRAGVNFSLGDYLLAAQVIGLSRREVALVVNAADDDRPSSRTNRLRTRLLIAMRLESPPATPPRSFDPMDRALADLIAGRAVAGWVAPPPIEQTPLIEREKHTENEFLPV